MMTLELRPIQVGTFQLSFPSIGLQVLSSSTTGFYIIFSSSNRCSCKAWQFRTWKNLGRMGPANAAFAFTCKHVLAARLAERVMTDKLQERLMEEDMFVSTVAEIQ